MEVATVVVLVEAVVVMEVAVVIMITIVIKKIDESIRNIYIPYMMTTRPKKATERKIKGKGQVALELPIHPENKCDPDRALGNRALAIKVKDCVTLEAIFK